VQGLSVVDQSVIITPILSLKFDYLKNSGYLGDLKDELTWQKTW
jgi:hypothetical protein